jgi:hypothetical protein
VKSAAREAVVEGTNAKQVRAWSRYIKYLHSIRLQDDVFLENFSRANKLKILCAFAQSIREGRFCGRNSRVIKSESVRATLDCVAQAYKLADRSDPRLNADGKLAFVLQRQLRGYSSSDPPPSPQIAITVSMLREFHKLSISAADKALCELFTGAFFFAMRSCEYVKVSGPRKMKLLTVNNIRFLKGCRILPHNDPLLHLADCNPLPSENLGKHYSPNHKIPKLKQGHNSKHLPITEQQNSPILRH